MTKITGTLGECQGILEEWREIPGYDGYEVSSLGKIRSYWQKKRNRQGLGFEHYISNNQPRNLKPYLDGAGYLAIELCGLQCKVHRLVLLAFDGPCPAGHECRHLDGTRTNNARSNLKWGTQKENRTDMLLHKTRPLGITHWNCRIGEGQIKEIRKLNSEGVFYKDIIRIFGISKTHYYNIINRLVWKHI